MDLTNLKAFEVYLDVDDKQLTQELLNLPEGKWETNTDPYSRTSWATVWLTTNPHKVFNDFKSAKTIPHSDWSWDSTLDISYIKSLVESLPIKTIGMVRAFILDGPLVSHVDSDSTTPDDISYSLGLTIASELNDPMVLDGTVIKEKYVFFNDSSKHGFPTSTGRQVSIRVFGDFDYEQFNIGNTYER